MSTVKIFLPFLLFFIVCNSFAYWIEGYTDKQSYLPGEQINFYLSTTNSVPYILSSMPLKNFNQDVVFDIPLSSSISQQTVSNGSPFSDGYGFSPTCSWTIPQDFRSGFYLLFGHIPLVIKCSAEVVPDIVVVVPTNTINAYTLSNGDFEGESMYTLSYNSENTNPIVSFLRPQSIDNYGHYDDGLYRFLLQYDHEVIHFPDYSLSIDYNVEYIADIDMIDYNEIALAKIVIIPGHSEYWSRNAKVNFDRFVDNGGDALVLSGNAFWWQVRYEDENYNQDYTKLACYRDPSLDLVYYDYPLLTTTHWGVPFLKSSILGSIGADWLRGGIGVDAGSNVECYNGFYGYRILRPN